MQNPTQDYDYLFKIVLIGLTNVGKSALLLRFTQNLYTQQFAPTMGIDFKIRLMQTAGHKVKFQLWDTSGLFRFRQITTGYYNRAHAIIMVYDVTDKRSFQQIQTLHHSIDQYANTDVVRILVANKADFQAKRQVSTEEGKILAQKLGVKFLQTSARDDINIEKVFTTLTNQIKAKTKKPVQTQENALPQKAIQKKNQNKKIRVNWKFWKEVFFNEKVYLVILGILIGMMISAFFNPFRSLLTDCEDFKDQQM